MQKYKFIKEQINEIIQTYKNKDDYSIFPQICGSV